MVTPSLADYRHETTRQAANKPEKIQAKAQAIHERTTRGLITFNRGNVHHLEGNLWAVPSSRGGFHKVDLEHETCDCEDYACYGRVRQIPCHHIYASAIANAARRSGVREVRDVRVAAGDPIAFAGKKKRKKGCPACIKGTVYIGYAAVNDDGEEVEAFHARKCNRCCG